MKMRVRVEVIRKLLVYEPTMEVGAGMESLDVGQRGNKQTYAKGIKQKFIVQCYYHYPFVIDGDGSLWGAANRYLLSYLEGADPAKYRTLESAAGDLRSYRQWTLDNDIDYLYIPKRRRARPTYRYCYYLHEQLLKGTIKINTAKRKMSSVQRLYQWHVLNGMDFDYSLWIEGDVRVNYKDNQGCSQSKNVKTTDLIRSFKTAKNSSDYDEFIDDGGKLRPLPKKEQTALIDSLCRVANIEMFLSFMFALVTGARLLTVFTLRMGIFFKVRLKNMKEVKLNIGLGTLVDNKNDKQMVLHVPGWLYDRIHIYLKSDRYKNRVTKSLHVYEDEGQQYVFLTRNGRPYYMSEYDPFSSLYRNPARGNAVTQFIRQQLKPDLLAHGFDFTLIFHYLRATFGMNLLEEKLNEQGAYDANKPEVFQVLMFIRERMGHSSLTTTEGYLNYRHKFYLAMQVQGDFEKYLESISHKFGESYDLG